MSDHLTSILVDLPKGVIAPALLCLLTYVTCRLWLKLLAQTRIRSRALVVIAKDS